MFKHLLLPWLLPIFGTFFAAGAAAITDGGGDAGAVDAGADSGEMYGGDIQDDAPIVEDQSTEKPVEQKTTETQEEPEVQEFKGAVSARLRNLTKQAPELTQVFQKYPKIQEQIEATFRREAALREVFPTVAEARQMREHFPNGLADVQELQSAVKEVEELDGDFYERDAQGNYPGHARIVENMFRDDREAAVSLFKGLPKQWAKLDPESYNDVMSKVVGATIAHSGVIDFIQELTDAAKEAKADGVVQGLGKLLNWASGYLKEKPKPTAEQEQLNSDRQKFNQEKQAREKEEGHRFNNSFVSESKKLQTTIIKGHPAVKKLLENKTLTDQKKSEIIEQVRKNMESFLGKSPSFMNKLRPAYSSRNLQETINLQKAAWSQQWLLNRMIRTVFSKEIPQMVSNNRKVVERRAGAPATQKPGTTGERKSGPQPPKQIGGRWYRDGGNGAPFTTAEVLAGKHME